MVNEVKKNKNKKERKKKLRAAKQNIISYTLTDIPDSKWLNMRESTK